MKNISKSAFKFDDSSRYIACVGTNGGTTDFDIMLGFYDAAKCIQSSLSKLAEDTIVYPLCFCERHCVELGLKIIIKNILAFDCVKIRENPNDEKYIKNALKQHDIKGLYNSLQKLEVVDKRLKSKIKAINYMHKLFEFYFDNMSDTFRYDMPLKGNINKFVKEKITHISLDKLWSDFDGIYINIQECISFTDALLHEYALKVYTKNLSKDDLIRIAKKIPKKFNWDSYEFKKSSNEIKNKYKISSREFSEALNIIKNHRTLCLLIGVENIYKKFTKGFIEIYKSFYSKHNYIKKSIMNRTLSQYNSDDLQPMLEEYNERESFVKMVSKKDIKLLYLFFIYGQDHQLFVEHMDDVYCKLESNNHMLNDYVRNLLSKPALKFIYLGMKRTGQKTYLSEFKKGLKSDLYKINK